MRRLGTWLAVLLVAASCGQSTDAPGAGAPGVPAATDPPLTQSTITGTTPRADAPATTHPTATVEVVEVAPPTTASEDGDDAVELRPTVLRRGDEGPWVVRLQEELQRHGYSIAADGTFGAATEEAVRGFQYAHRLEVDGLAGPATWNALLHGEVLPVVERPPSVEPLRADGLGTFDFGTPAEQMIGPLIAELGAPSGDHTWPYCDGDSPCVVEEQTIRWAGSVNARFAVVFHDYGDGLRFDGWELMSWGGEGHFGLATSAGVTLGTSAGDLLAAHPETQFGFWPEPGCGDAWWYPGAFRIGSGASGMRGSVATDDPYGALEQAIIGLGFPDGLTCFHDVMCSGLFAQVQAVLGLHQTHSLDRATWLALGLPLPPDSGAPVHELRAGRLVSEC